MAKKTESKAGAGSASPKPASQKPSPARVLSNLAELRRRAQKLLADGALRGDPTLAQDRDRLLHELSLQHADLLAQNEKLFESQVRLTAAQQRLERIFADSPLGFMVLGQNGTVQEASHRAAELFAIPGGLAGRSLDRFLPLPDRSRLVEALTEAAATEARQVLELRYTPYRKRQPRRLRLSLSRLEPEPERPALVLAMAEDTTDEHQVRQRLLDAKRKMEGEVARRTADLTAANQRLNREVQERAGTEEALRQSRGRLRVVVDAMHESMTVLDSGGRILFANARAADSLFAAPPAQVVGRNIADCIPSAQTTQILADYGQVLASGRSLTREIMITVAGEQRWFLNRMQPIRFGPDNGPAILSLSLEITARKRAEAALNEGEERLRTILGSVQAGVLVVDPATRRIVIVNEAACRLMGRTREEVLGHACHRFACPHLENRCPVLDLGQEMEASERRLRHASGRTVPVLKTVTRIQLDGREHLLECFMDLTERKRIEAAYHGVADSASDAIYLHGVTPDGRPGPFLDANPAACRMLGYTRDELQRLTPQDLDATSTPPGHTRRVTSELLERGQTLFEVVHVAKDGRLVPVEIHARLLGQGGGPPMVLCVARDVSARKAAEAAANRARAEAEAASRAKSEFLANMSHELRTPLNGIMGMLQLMEDTSLDQEQRQYADIAMQSARGMLSLVNDLLDLSRIEAGRMPIQDEALDLRDLLESVCQVFDPPARAKGVALRCTVYPGVPHRLLGDPARLRQVLFNLVGNAVKFTEAGEVSIEVSVLETPGGCGPARLFFSVADTGVGVDEEQLARVFHPFVQVDGSATRRFGGAGLGLAITRRLLALMDGRLAVDSTPGRGSEFAFSLPLREAEAGGRTAPLPAKLPAAEAEDRSLRLLLAEDEPVNRLAAKLMLERLGHRVDQAADGEEALAALARSPYDCVLLDISMPVLDGLQVVRRLRALEAESRRPRTPVVAMTAHAMAGDRERFLGEGCDGYLAKPVDLDELTQALAEAARPTPPGPTG